MKRILVVGSKNTYRSIILAECLKKAFKDKGNNGTELICAGIMAFPGIPAEQEAVDQLKNEGIEGEFKSRPLQKQLLLDTDEVITVSGKIKAVITAKFTGKAEIIRTFGEITGGDDDIQAGPGLAGEIKRVIDLNYDKFI